MKQVTKRFALAMAFTAGLVSTSSLANVNLTTFDNVNTGNLGSPYGSWTPASLMAGPTSFNVTSSGGFGGVYYPLPATVNATGTSNIVLTVNWTNTSASPPSSGDGVV